MVRINHHFTNKEYRITLAHVSNGASNFIVI
jgi:hypothetical protein